MSFVHDFVAGAEQLQQGVNKMKQVEEKWGKATYGTNPVEPLLLLADHVSY